MQNDENYRRKNFVHNDQTVLFVQNDEKKSALCTNRARGRIGREGWAEAHLCKTTKLNTFLLLVIMTKLFQKSRSEKIFVQIAENKYS